MSRSTKRHPQKSCPNGRRNCVFCSMSQKIRAKERKARLAQREQADEALEVVS
jgi:biotin synthase-like enzyme